MPSARTLLGLVRVGLHLSAGLGAVAVLYPLASRKRRLRMKQTWSRALLDILSVSIEAAGAPPSGGVLVSNHVSWLDIYVINALTPSAFVCKADVRHWPVIGWLCARTDTVFIERGSAVAAKQTAERLGAILAEGACPVAVFPEGTTTDGFRLLPFRAAMLQAAIDVGVDVHPVAIRYLDGRGAPSRRASYCGDTTFWESLTNILAARGMVARVTLLPALATRGAHRRQIAAHARQTIGRALEMPTHWLDDPPYAASATCATSQPIAAPAATSLG